MQTDEAYALGKLLGKAIAGTVSAAEGLERAIFARSAVAGGPPAKVIHDGIAGTLYAGAHGLSHALGRAAGAGIALARVDEGERLADSPAGAVALGALGGVHGDLLERDGSALVIEMALRERGRDIALDRPSLAAGFPEATSRLSVFVHGLCGTEETWWMFGDKSDHYGPRLQRDLGFTPLYVRYNTGLRISENGRRLARLLADVADSWPVDIDEIALFGHSMGGLVVRSACHYGELAAEPWVENVRHVFCLASPHLGAPLEKAANVAGWAFGQLAETRPLARIINGRSEGIKDLRFGYLVEEDWNDSDPDSLLENNRHHIPFLATANYYYVSATLSRDPHHPLGHLIGDLLVRFPSASGKSGKGESIPFHIDNGHHAGGLTHFHVLNNRDIYRQIHAWIEREQLATPLARGLAPDPSFAGGG